MDNQKKLKKNEENFAKRLRKDIDDTQALRKKKKDLSDRVQRRRNWKKYSDFKRPKSKGG